MDMGLQLASHACASCRHRKRKCEKFLPRCSLCYKKDLICTYSTGNTPPSLAPWSDVFFPNRVLNPETPKFPAVFFLDANLFQKA
ncbi:hypothetical protein BDZ45DRAFT_671954 [Acephala macrosclerotiorum]|nr:hypothetical protein BDZ45DRAFT_671954 [Acephala macrosclerotiorum]